MPAIRDRRGWQWSGRAGPCTVQSWWRQKLRPLLGTGDSASQSGPAWREGGGGAARGSVCILPGAPQAAGDSSALSPRFRERVNSTRRLSFLPSYLAHSHRFCFVYLFCSTGAGAWGLSQAGQVLARSRTRTPRWDS